MALVKVGPVYVIPGGAPGLIIRGNIDLFQQPVIRNPNGSYSTVRSVSWKVPVNIDGGIRQLEVLMPTAIRGNTVIVSDRAALNHFLSTGQHLGMFDTVTHANTYSDRLHLWYVKNRRFFIPRAKAKAGRR